MAARGWVQTAAGRRIGPAVAGREYSVAWMACKVTVGIMKSAVPALIIIATIWCYPLAAEDTTDPCDALASQALRLEVRSDEDANKSDTVTLIKSFGDFIVSEAVKRRYPSVPPGIVCTGYYWRLIADPVFVGTITGRNDAE
jgi:hypothetical protein